MKHGILFFMNMGNITLGARIAILPLIYLTFFQVRPFGVVYFICFALLVLSVLLSLIPAPSDRAARRAIEAFHYEHKEEMMERCGFSNDKRLFLLYGYAEDSKMWMKRTLGREVVYPYPIAISFVNHLDRGRLLIGKKSLIKKMPVEYLFLKDEELLKLEADMTVEPDHDEVAILSLSHPSFPEDFTIYVKNDYCVRELMDSLRKKKIS